MNEMIFPLLEKAVARQVSIQETGLTTTKEEKMNFLTIAEFLLDNHERILKTKKTEEWIIRKVTQLPEAKAKYLLQLAFAVIILMRETETP